MAQMGSVETCRHCLSTESVLGVSANLDQYSKHGIFINNFILASVYCTVWEMELQEWSVCFSNH